MGMSWYTGAQWTPLTITLKNASVCAEALYCLKTPPIFDRSKSSAPKPFIARTKLLQYGASPRDRWWRYISQSSHQLLEGLCITSLYGAYNYPFCLRARRWTQTTDGTHPRAHGNHEDTKLISCRLEPGSTTYETYHRIFAATTSSSRKVQ